MRANFLSLCVNHMELDEGVSEERIHGLLTERTDRLNQQLKDLLHE